MSYTVILDNRGNPDRGQHANLRLPGVPTRKAKVADFEGASKACREYIEKHELGGGNWTGGKVLDAKGKEVAYVSYNGKVWPPGGYAVGVSPLWPEEEPKPEPVATPRPDPYAHEVPTLDTPYGPVSLHGDLENCAVRNHDAEEFVVGGESCLISAWLEFDGDRLGGSKSWLLLRNGWSGHDVDHSKVRPVIEKAVMDWLEEPANMAVLVRNTIKTRRRAIENITNEIARAERRLADTFAETERLEAMLDGLGPDAPRNR